MGAYPVIIDSRPPWLRSSNRPTSLLLTPFGTGTFLSHLREAAAQVTEEALIVLAPFEPDAAYERALRRCVPSKLTLMSADRFGELFAAREPSDWLLLIDSRCYPIDGIDLLSMKEDPSGAAGVRHLVGLASGSEGTQELVQFDADRQVRRIDRLYGGVTWIQASGVSSSLVSVASARMLGEERLTSLSALRRALAENGSVPSHDVSLPCATVDLTREDALLGVMERRITEVTSAPPPPPSPYTLYTQDVYAGQRCAIHPSARIHGSVIIQDDVTIEAGAVVIGPTLLGAGCRVGQSAIVAQCLVQSNMAVPRETSVRHRVVGEAAIEDLFGERRTRSGMPSEGARRLADLAGAGISTTAVEKRQRGRSVYLGLKRVIDGVIALVGLIVLSPLLAATSVLVKLTSPGTVLYGDKREGKERREFRCWKFRSMVEGAHSLQRDLYEQNTVDGPQFKLSHDPRITGIGHWMRATNIDELPQLINVVLGQMSLIGPRPSPFRENQICVPWRRARLSVRPGITGLWQICRHERSTGDFHQWIYYDMLYVRHMSLWLDVKILIATVLTVGGRWSVPLDWMIPLHKLHPDDDASEAVTWTPDLTRRDASDAPGAGLRSDGVESDPRAASAGRPGGTSIQEWVPRLGALALTALGRMYRPDRHRFGHSIRRTSGGDVLVGLSPRYTATVLLGLTGQPPQVASKILGGQSPQEVCGHLIESVEGTEDLGEVALTLWSARTLDHPLAGKALARLQAMAPAEADHPIVEIAWSLTALSVEGKNATDDDLAAAIARRLLSSFEPSSGVFPHWPTGMKRSFLRGHVGCFADQVYPIQALSHYYMRSGETDAVQAATRCADQICALQGAAGEWWWHYDVRTGAVVEGYPVYAVHQDAMAPMALFALRDACGTDHTEHIERGMSWLIKAPETDSSLVDWETGLIWRKVGRHEFGKWSRAGQALASRLHPSLRVPAINLLAPPHAVDYECRPYHLGWLLYAWSNGRVREISEQELYLGTGEILSC